MESSLWVLSVGGSYVFKGPNSEIQKEKTSQTQSCLILGHTEKVLHAPENPHCTANEGALRAANLQSTQWYLCRGGTKAVPLRDSFNMIQRNGWTPTGIGKFSISLPLGWAPPHFRSCLHCSVFAWKQRSSPQDRAPSSWQSRCL